MRIVAILALASTALAVPTAASAAGEPFSVYKNRGQCESALATELNRERKADTSGMTPSEWNAFVHQHWSCQQAPDGTWSWVFTP